MIPPAVLYAGATLMGNWLKSVFGGSGGPTRIHYTLYPVPPHRVAEFVRENAPACSVPRFCELLREHRYPEDAVRECLRSASRMERENAGAVILVARVWEE